MCELNGQNILSFSYIFGFKSLANYILQLNDGILVYSYIDKVMSIHSHYGSALVQVKPINLTKALKMEFHSLPDCFNPYMIFNYIVVTHYFLLF